MDHPEARAVFARVLARRPVPKEDEDAALLHAATCDDCARDFSGEAGASSEARVDPEVVFDRALTAALRTHPEAIGRRRAAEELGAGGRASPAAVAALKDVAAGDDDARVRIAALRALEALGVPPPPPPRGPAPA